MIGGFIINNCMRRTTSNMEYIADINDTSHASPKTHTKIDMFTALWTKYEMLKYHYHILEAYVNSHCFEKSTIERVIFDKNATTIIWNGGEKTTVKAYHEPIDHEKGLAMAIVKHIFQDDQAHWKSSFDKILAKAEDDEIKRIVYKAMKELRKVYSDTYEKECKKGWLESGSDVSNSAHEKALKAAVRARKKYIPTETGLAEARIEKAIQEALETYSENCRHQQAH